MTEDERSALLYQENAKVAAIFWEWRYKVMVSFFAGVSGLFALAGWFYLQAELRVLLFAPFALGGVFCLAALALDLRNAAILRECYRIGAELESKLGSEGAIFKSIGATNFTKVTYTVILRLVYAGIGLLLMALTYRAWSRFP